MCIVVISMHTVSHDEPAKLFYDIWFVINYAEHHWLAVIGRYIKGWLAHQLNRYA